MWDHIAADSLRAADTLDQQFNDASTHLSRHPQMGKRGEMPGTRELLVHDHYRLIYLIEDECVVMISIVQTARQWPPPTV